MKKYSPLLASLVIAGLAPAYAQNPSKTTPRIYVSAPSVAQTSSVSETEQFQKIEDQWSIAEVKHDQYTLELLLSPVYVGVSSHGDVTTRNQQIALLFDRGPSQLTSMEQKVVNVRTFGDLAVVQGTYMVKHHDNGKDIEDRGIFTHLFQRVRNNWVCVNAQRTLVSEAGDGKPAKVSKKTDGALPFHVRFSDKGE